jgi:ribosomal protein L12E/L44/L45/RPP1/RPP2
LKGRDLGPLLAGVGSAGPSATGAGETTTAVAVVAAPVEESEEEEEDADLGFDMFG